MQLEAHHLKAAECPDQSSSCVKYCRPAAAVWECAAFWIKKSRRITYLGLKPRSVKCLAHLRTNGDLSHLPPTLRGDNWWAVCGECHIVYEGPPEPHSTSCNSYSSSSSSRRRRKWHPPSTSPNVTGASSSSSSWPGCRDRMSNVVTERVASLSLPPATQPQHWQLLQ
ncbi:uncharacterized protein LOC135102147 isoform X2 [Scylla paramamosain]|uniref:uncharacterized protein LOC135102147 isoform X2 n=1 Tax=Scylla paramamosain TaxID=85552 RepID=UPI003083255E